MPEPVAISAQTVPEGTCWPGAFQDALNLIAANLIGSLSDAVTLINFGPNTPTVDRQDQPWLRTDANGKFLGVYTFTNGSWQPADPPFKTGDVMPVALASQVIAAPWYLMNGQVVNGITVPDWRGRMIIGAGQRTLPGGSNDTATLFNIGDIGGEEKHLLTTAEVPYLGTSDGSNTGTNDPVHTQNTVNAGEVPHNNLPPYAAAQWKMYISAADAGLT